MRPIFCSPQPWFAYVRCQSQQPPVRRKGHVVCRPLKCCPPRLFSSAPFFVRHIEAVPPSDAEASRQLSGEKVTSYIASFAPPCHNLRFMVRIWVLDPTIHS